MMSSSYPQSTIDPVPIEGSAFSIRPVLAEDKQLLRDGFERLSDRSRHHRFLTPTPTLSRGQVAYLTEIDHQDHVALGVLDGTVPVAVGRWIRLDDDRESADVGLTVVDAAQGKGLGGFLIQALALTARHRGVRWMHFDVLATNTPMVRLIDRFDSVRTDFGPIIHAVLDAESVPRPAGLDDRVLRQLDIAARLAG